MERSALEEDIYRGSVAHFGMHNINSGGSLYWEVYPIIKETKAIISSFGVPYRLRVVLGGCRGNMPPSRCMGTAEKGIAGTKARRKEGQTSYLKK
jgi:hypothetical protein